MNIDELVDRIAELVEYLFDWANTYTGKYNYVDHTQWEMDCMLMLRTYHFDIDKIKEDIKNGTILLEHYDNPRIKKYENRLYEMHKKKVEEFERKYDGRGIHST